MAHFKDYLQRMHSDEVKNYWFSPTVALPFLSVCHCNYKVTEATICDDTKVSDGASLHPALLGKSYHVCPSSGCGFFKWKDDVGAHPGSSLLTAICECGLKPITLELAPPKTKKQKREQNPKKFQVCRENGCDFFRWFEPPPTPKGSKKGEQLFSYCSKHLILQEHTKDPVKQKLWWKENCEKHLGDKGSAKSQMDFLKRRLLIVSSMAFTRIPGLVSRNTPDSMLILMR